MVAKSILPTLGGTPMAWNTRLRGTEVVDLVEAEAARDDRFTWALGKIWIVAKGLPPDVVERIVIASDLSCAWLCHALLLTRLQLNFGVGCCSIVWANHRTPLLHRHRSGYRCLSVRANNADRPATEGS